MWTSKNNAAIDNSNKKTWNEMRTNLSRYTCCFSDYPWSVAFPEEEEKQQQDAQSFFFPSTDQMHDYLKSYSHHFLEIQSDCNFRVGCQVTRVSPLQDNRYCVEWKNTVHDDGKDPSFVDEQQIFDGVVVASGFFSEPAWPEGVDLSSFKGRHIHSSQYRSPDLDLQDGSTVAICGSSFSALEISAHIAKSATTFISSATKTTAIKKESVSGDHKKRRVVHIAPSMPWVMPRFVEYKTGFVPLDIALYRRPNEGIKTEVVLGNDPEINKQKHGFLKNMLGTRKQRLLNKDIRQPFDDPTLPVYSSISNEYLDLASSGRIELVPGRLVGCNEQGSLGVVDYFFKKPNDDIQEEKISFISGVDTLISATGFNTNLDFLDSESVLSTLEYQKENKFVPLILCDEVYHPNLKNLAFVGMYRGQYFGVVELQAQLAAAKLAMQLGCPEEDRDNGKQYPSAEQQQKEDEAAFNVARQIRDQSPQPQFPHSDYVGRMDSLVSKIKQLPYNSLGDAPLFSAKGEVVLPAMY
jgi:hypothetical protein